MKLDVPEGSIILRPSVSEIKKTSSAEATAALVMEVKLRKVDAQPFEGHSSECEYIELQTHHHNHHHQIFQPHDWYEAS